MKKMKGNNTKYTRMRKRQKKRESGTQSGWGWWRRTAGVFAPSPQTVPAPSEEGGPFVGELAASKTPSNNRTENTPPPPAPLATPWTRSCPSLGPSFAGLPGFCCFRFVGFPEVCIWIVLLCTGMTDVPSHSVACPFTRRNGAF